jgi:hypothetical protein
MKLRNAPAGFYLPDHAESIYSFADEHCNDCIHDRNEDCPHLAAAFRGEVKVWVMDDKGCASCTEKRLPGETPRCPQTLELPL